MEATVPKHEIPTITVGRLLDDLKIYPAHFRLSFGGLRYYRPKQRDDDLVQIEFDQPVYLDNEGCVVVDNLE